MRTAILGAVAAVGVSAGVAPAQYISGGVVFGGPVVRPAPVVVAPAPVVVRPAPVVVAPTSGFSVGIGLGGYGGGVSVGGVYSTAPVYPAAGVVYRPSYVYPAYGYRPYYGYGHHHHGW